MFSSACKKSIEREQGADVKMSRGEPLMYQEIKNLKGDELHNFIKSKTVWDYCRCPTPNRDIPIYTKPRPDSGLIYNNLRINLISII